MPRGGGGTFQNVPGTTVSPNTTIQSAWANAFSADVETTFNTAWPVSLGGTGGTSPVSSSDSLSTKGANIASAATTDLSGATGRFVHITGTSTITSFGTSAAGVERSVVFDGILTVTHNATTLILPGESNIVTGAGDTATLFSEGSGNWRMTSFIRAGSINNDAKGVTIASAASIALGTSTGNFVDISGTTNISSLGTAAVGVEKTIRFLGVLVLINSANLALYSSLSLTTYNGLIMTFRSLGAGAWVETSQTVNSGTWTPAIAIGTPGNITIGYSVQTGGYTKVGRLVKLDFNLVTSTFTHTTASGSLTITGVPTPAASITNRNGYGSVVFQGVNKAAYSNVTPGVFASSPSTITMLCTAMGQNATGLLVTDCPTGGTVVFQGTLTYEAAS